jgi:hypothetical protein
MSDLLPDLITTKHACGCRSFTATPVDDRCPLHDYPENAEQAAALPWIRAQLEAAELVERLEGPKVRSLRERRGHEAGLAAVDELRRKRTEADARTEHHLRITITPWPNTVRWCVWDARPAYDEQVEGVLVPYALGGADSAAAAETDARSAVARWAEANPGHSVVIERVERTRA